MNWVRNDMDNQMMIARSFRAFKMYKSTMDFYRQRSLAKQGDNALGSVRPSVCPFVHLCALRSGRY